MYINQKSSLFIEKRFLEITVFLMLLVLVMPATAKENISEVVEDGDRVFVRCTTTSPKKMIVRNAETGLWCDSKMVDFCRARKMRAAILVCSEEYYSAKRNFENSTPKKSLVGKAIIEEPKTSKGLVEPDSNVVLAADFEKEKQRYALELELVEIEQQRLEIKKRRLELVKRENELRQ